MPKELELLLQKNGSRPEDSVGNETDYLERVPRKIDVVLMCVYYGLYVSKELPPSKIDDGEGSYEFNVGIDKEVQIIRDLLLLMWIKQNDKMSDSFDIEYRQEIYAFLNRILNNDYLLKVVFPFYLDKANSDGEVSFISKLSQSRFVPWKRNPYSPERLALDFTYRKREFETYITKALQKTLEKHKQI